MMRWEWSEAQRQSEGISSDMSPEIAANLWGFIQWVLAPIASLSALIPSWCSRPPTRGSARLEIDAQTQYLVSSNGTTPATLIYV